MYFKTWALFANRIIACRKFSQFKKAEIVPKENNRNSKERFSRWTRGLQGLRFKMHSVTLTILMLREKMEGGAREQNTRITITIIGI